MEICVCYCVKDIRDIAAPPCPYLVRGSVESINNDEVVNENSFSFI